MDIERDKFSLISSISKEKQRIQMFLEFPGVDIVTPQKILEFLEYKKTLGLKNNYLIALKGVLKKAVFQYLRFNNATFEDLFRWEEFFKSIKIRKNPSPFTKDQIPSKEEIIGMLEGCESERNRLVIMALYLTGFRNSELRLLKLSDITRHKKVQKNGNVYFYDLYRVFGKNQRMRVVPVDIRLKDSIIKAFNPKIFLFENPVTKKPYSDRTLQRIVEQESRIIGKDFHPHLIRHSHGSDFYELTKDVKTNSEHMGHSPRMSMEVYTHSRDPEDKILSAFNMDLLEGAG